MQVQAKLGSEGFFVERKAVVVAALFEGDEENIGHFAAKDAPSHFNIRVSDNRYWGRDGGFGEGTAQCPAAEDVPLVDFGVAFEFGELVFGGLGEFNTVNGWFHELDCVGILCNHRCTQMNTDEMDEDG